MVETDNKRKSPEIGAGAAANYFVYTSKTKAEDIPEATLTHLRVDSSVREIPDNVFRKCRALEQVLLPETLSRIGKSAFHFCSKLKSIQFFSERSPESSIDPNSEDGTIVFPERANLLVDELAFCNCASLRKVIVCSVSTKFGRAAFANCFGLISIELPEGLELIGPELCSNCRSLTTVKIPSSVIKIGDNAFYRCKSLTSVDLPHGLLGIGDRSFEQCVSIETLPIPSTVTAIGNFAFCDCKGLKQMVLPPTLERIETKTFSGCGSLGYIEIPLTVSFIGYFAFYGCHSLSHLRMPPSIENVGIDAFLGCNNLISVELPEGFWFSNTEDRMQRMFVEHRIFVEVSDTCPSLVNLALPEDDEFQTRLLHENSKLGSVVQEGTDLSRKLKHRFDSSSLNKLCYYQSYQSSEDAMMQLRGPMEDDPLAATSQVDEFGMTPLHVLSLNQSLNVDMLLAVVRAGYQDQIIHSRDSFGSTPMDYLCSNRMPNSNELIRTVIQTRFGHLFGSDPSRKSDMLQAVDKALAVDWSAKRRKVVAIYLKLANYERKEIFSLMELCLWKAKINEEVSSKKGQMTDRQRCRINCGASIVIPHVLPFLDKLDIKDYFVGAP
eukprot:scaffold3074_cov108-Cylindrotheca_fusiformis.AAC.2